MNDLGLPAPEASDERRKLKQAYRTVYSTAEGKTVLKHILGELCDGMGIIAPSKSDRSIDPYLVVAIAAKVEVANVIRDFLRTDDDE